MAAQYSKGHAHNHLLVWLRHGNWLSWTLPSKIKSWVGILILTWVCMACHSGTDNPPEQPVTTNGGLSNFVLPDSFSAYWFDGSAEVNQYVLSQARYGSIRPGAATLIFVTEDFLPDIQVKNESSEKNDAISVLKCNAIRQFTTGIYQYQLMTSTFTPIELTNYAGSLKVTASSQEWCGMMYTQLNRKPDGWYLRSHSYFMAEADHDTMLQDVMPEDELLNRIRMGPNQLPAGKITLLPSLSYAQIKHKQVVPTDANLQISGIQNVEGFSVPVVLVSWEMLSLERKVKIYVGASFPYPILGWDESYPDGDGILTSSARLTNSRRLPYWSLTTPADTAWRDTLGIH